MTEQRRKRRVEETIRKYIADALTRDYQDPRLSGLMVTRVDVTGDLSLARVYVRSMTAGADKAAQAKLEQSVRRLASPLRRAVGPKLGIRKTPELSFHYDTDQDALDHVASLLEEIKNEGQ